MLFLFVFVIGTQPAKAQQSVTRNEFWPEVDIYINVKPKVRIFLLGTMSKSVEDGEIRNAQSFEAQIGAHIDYIPNDHLILRVGYRYGTSVGEASSPYKEHRILTEQTLRKLLPGALLLSDRNREDFRFVSGDFSFRYRNRVSIEREVDLFKGRTITPYVSAEIFYDTRSNASTPLAAVPTTRKSSRNSTISVTRLRMKALSSTTSTLFVVCGTAVSRSREAVYKRR